MSLWAPPSLGWIGDTNLTAASRDGTAVTSSATLNTKGAWVALLDPVSEPACGFWVRLRGTAVSTAVHTALVDIAIGPAGGGSEEIIVPDLGCGSATADHNVEGKMYFIPYPIPAGVRVSARMAANTASKAGQVAIWLAQRPEYPMEPCGPVVAYGVDAANSRGTSVTTGNGAFPANWTAIGAPTSRPHKYWTCAIDQLADTTIATARGIVELGIGSAVNNVTTIFRGAFSQSSTEQIGPVFPHLSYCPVPAGAQLYARIASAEAEARGLIIYGM